MKEEDRQTILYFLNQYVIQKIKSKPKTEWIHVFLQSIDEYRKENPKYDEIISHPIDLQTLKKNLQ